VNKRMQSGRHSIYSLQYHLILCTKNRRRVLCGDIASRAREEFLRISTNNEVEVLNVEVAEDYVHLLIRGKPTTDLVKYVNVLKGISSRELRRHFPQLKGQGDALWSPSYFLATTGEVTLDMLKSYVDEHEAGVSRGYEGEGDI